MGECLLLLLLLQLLAKAGLVTWWCLAIPTAGNACSKLEQGCRWCATESLLCVLEVAYQGSEAPLTSL